MRRLLSAILLTLIAKLNQKSFCAGLIHQTIPDVEGTEPRPIWLYRPQHDDDCQLNRCFYCGQSRTVAHEGHVFATTALCSCGLNEALIAVMGRDQRAPRQTVGGNTRGWLDRHPRLAPFVIVGYLWLFGALVGYGIVASGHGW